MITLKTEILYACSRLNKGFVKKIQPGKSLYLKYTTDILEAKLYKNKTMAARGHNYKNPNHPDLTFYEVKVIYEFPDANNEEL